MYMKTNILYVLFVSLLLLCSCADMNGAKRIHLGDSRDKVEEVFGDPNTELKGERSDTYIWCYYIYIDIWWSFNKGNLCFEFDSDYRVINKTTNANLNTNTNQNLNYDRDR